MKNVKKSKHKQNIYINIYIHIYFIIVTATRLGFSLL